MNVMRNISPTPRIRRASQRIALPTSVFPDLDYLDELQELETIRAARAGVRRSRMMRDDRYI